MVQFQFWRSYECDKKVVFVGYSVVLVSLSFAAVSIHRHHVVLVPLQRNVLIHIFTKPNRAMRGKKS